MATHHGLHALTAAALAAAVLLVRRRAARGTHDADVAEASWSRAASPPDGGESTPDRVAELHASFLEPAPALREADAHLEQCWNRLASLYPHSEGERRHG
ncbi:hypothetical protein [Streptomyces sp. NPDC058664]|uniref:hypothetical protein n=1 Tax=unclassified Streptomyces TaxID=2593676 RepID=UPI00365F09DA